MNFKNLSVTATPYRIRYVKGAVWRGHFVVECLRLHVLSDAPCSQVSLIGDRLPQTVHDVSLDSLAEGGSKDTAAKIPGAICRVPDMTVLAGGQKLADNGEVLVDGRPRFLR